MGFPTPSQVLPLQQHGLCNIFSPPQWGVLGSHILRFCEPGEVLIYHVQINRYTHRHSVKTEKHRSSGSIPCLAWCNRDSFDATPATWGPGLAGQRYGNTGREWPGDEARVAPIIIYYQQRSLQWRGRGYICRVKV